MPVPVVLGILYAVTVPPAGPLGGGETEFADMRAAYDALPEAMKGAIDDLNFSGSSRRAGFSPYRYDAGGSRLFSL